MKTEDFYKTIPCKTAEDFLNLIQPNNPLWLEREPGPSTWIFRGQRDATLPLRPSAWREDARAKSASLRKELSDSVLRILHSEDRGNHPPPEGDENPQRLRLLELLIDVLVELETVSRFANIADELGLHISDGNSGDYYQQSRYWEIFKNQPKSFLSDSFNPSYAHALVQHHGLPTRLLDWSFSARKAAYFAASSAINIKNDDKAKLGLFAFNTSYTGTEYGVHKFLVPRENFRYLYAQEGLFVYLDADSDKLWKGIEEWPDMVQVLRKHGVQGEPSPIIRLTLPVREAKPVLEHLYHEGVTEAHLKPTYENINSLIRQEWNWGYVRKLH